jgi:hypothetical protein
VPRAPWIAAAALVITLSGCSSAPATVKPPVDPVHAAYDKLIEKYDDDCPDPGFGPACKSHTEELLALSRTLRDAIDKAEKPEVYEAATVQLDWVEDWASRGIESNKNQAGVSLSLSLLREWGDRHWTK